MENKFTLEERRRSLLKRHIKEHLFEYVLDVVGTVVCAVILLKICKAEEIFFGGVLAFVYALGKVVYQIVHYKKEWIDVDIK